MGLKYPKHHISISAMLAHAWFHFVFRLSPGGQMASNSPDSASDNSTEER